MDAKLTKDFKNPGTEYRGRPFWAWNGKLEPDELRRQIRIMKRMGLGGFFMHSRVGLATPYLADEWFECVDACISVAAILGMEAWLYDEDRWPSGAAGGFVTKNREYAMRAVRMLELSDTKELKWDADSIAAFVGRVDGASATGLRRIPKGKRPKLSKGESIIAFRHHVSEGGSWFNGEAYLDTLNPEGVKKFIDVTHEEYKKRCGEHFGKSVPGIFTDEPAYSMWGYYHWPTLAWTKKLPAIFKRRYGYDLLDHLPELFFDVDGKTISQPRYHYYDCITGLFTDSFARQIGDWCENNNMLFTGHVQGEDTLSSQIMAVGSAMRFYEHMQEPGMDLLTEHWHSYDAAKQVASAARQFGRKWRLTETYGCTGWDFPFAGHKALGDWQVALGINRRSHHLSWYTMEGEAKRDFPAGIFYQSPWWQIYPKVEDYYARIHAVMTRGEEVRDLLVIHPVESMWAVYRRNPAGNKAQGECEAAIAGPRDTLLGANIDYDYGDEEILARHASVRTVKGQPTLIVGKARYRAVVVPPLKTIRSSTLALLRKFRKAGGSVVFAGAVAEHVEALPSAQAADFARCCRKAPASGAGLVRVVEAACRRVSIADAKGREIGPALYLLREDRDACYLFVCNTGHSPAQMRKSGPMADVAVKERKAEFADVRIVGFAECDGRPVELDAETGEAHAAEAKKTAGGWEISTSLPALGSRLYLIPKKKSSAPPARKKRKEIRRTALRRKAWQISLSESNVLVLDRPRYRIGSDRPHGPEEILRVDRKIREALKVPPRGGAMVQPWARQKPAHPRHADVSLTYSFDVKAAPSGDLHLALERPDTFEASVNGVALSTDAECGWWTDRSLRKIPIDPSILRPGKNEITLRCDYTEEHPGLEIIYLLGNFGAAVNGTSVALTPMPTALRIGDWCRQGLAFYSGSVAYAAPIRPKLRKGDRLIVAVPDYRGAAVRVLVNGAEAGIIGWQPNEVDVTDFLVDGANDLRIQVIGHRRNSHGPLHSAKKWPHWTGPGEFVSHGDAWIDGYQLVPCGLMKPPELIVRA